MRRKSHRARDPVPSGGWQHGLARRLHGRSRRRSDLDQAMAAATRRLPVRRMSDDAPPSPSSDLIDAFCDHIWLREGLAGNSLAGYRQDLTAWAEWLASHVGKSLLEAQRHDVEAFLAAQFQ